MDTTPSPAGARQWASKMALAVAIAGVAATVALFFAARRAEWTAFDAELSRDVQRDTNRLEREIERIGFAIHAFQQTIAAHGSVDAETFATLAHPFLTENRDLRVIEWAPYVSDDRRAAVETAARARVSPTFRIFEHDSSGHARPAQRRADYFPVMYAASLQPETRALIGYDLASSPERRAVYQLATESGAMLVSPPTQLALLKDRGVIVLAPVFRIGLPTTTAEERRQALLGVIVTIYNVDRLLTEVAASTPWRPLALISLDYTLDGTGHSVYRAAPGHHTDLGWPRWMLPPQLERSAAFASCGVEWQVRIAVTPSYLAHNLPLIHWLVLPVGALIVALLTMCVWILARGRDHLAAKVNERTCELAAHGAAMSRVLDALDLAGDGVMILSPENVVTYANRMMLETLGARSQDEIVGRPSDDVLCGRGMIARDQLEILRAEIRANGAWKGEIPLPGGETGKRRLLLAHVRLLADGGRVAVVNDITGTREREEEQHRLEAQLEDARKLEVLGTLAAGIAHDFNNLLGAILGFAQFIVDDAGDGTPLHRYATRIIKAGQQAKCLISQILTFSHRREIPRERVNLGELVADNLSILKAIVAPSTALALETASDGAPVAGHSSELVQVLVNLVVNANEALEGGPGTVSIAVSDASPALVEREKLLSVPGDPREAPAVISWTDESGWHHAAFGTLAPAPGYRVLSVSDTGCGMNAETAQNIFSPFFTTKGNKGGTGLGLAVVQNVVINHQGALLVTTAPGRGSTFSLFLPQTTAELDDQQPPGETPPPELGAHQGSVLLVENSAHFSDMLMTALFRLGYEIATCSDTAEALEFIDEDPEAWNLVITDQVMPGMTGTELVSAIKARHPGLPCIVCTAYPGDQTETAARQAGADGFVTKPLDLGRFSLMVKELVTRRTGHASGAPEHCAHAPAQP